jgi:hypothetical protein
MQGREMSRPLFRVAWAASQRIYEPSDTGAKVAKVVGGFVEKNINNPDIQQRWSNTCAVRMSYILNESGIRIERIPGQTVSGADGRQYFFRVRNLIDFLKHRWGAPEIVKYPAENGGLLAGRKGVILFEVTGWSDAQGHATLFDGTRCYDHCYFNHPEAGYRTDRANFWSL